MRTARPSGRANHRPLCGIGPLSEGIDPLSEGIDPLSMGIDPLSEGIDPPSEGVGPLREGVGPLREGVDPLSTWSDRQVEEDDVFEQLVNDSSWVEAPALGDANMRNLKKGEVIQVERKGYFICVSAPHID